MLEFQETAQDCRLEIVMHRMSQAVQFDLELKWHHCIKTL